MRVYRRGGRLRLRRRLSKIGSMTLSIAMVSSAMAYALTAKPHAPKPKKHHVTAEPSPSHSPEPSHSDAPHSESPKPEPTHSETPQPPHSEEPHPSPSPAETHPVCHNSTDPACGNFYWDPAPGDNASMTTTLSWSPQQPKPGEDVTFTFTADDPDASIGSNKVFARYGDGPGSGEGPPSGCSGRYGPWTPPAKQHGHIELTFHHTYASAGEFHVSFLAISAGNECYQPYLSRGENNQTMHVVADPTPSPTGSPV